MIFTFSMMTSTLKTIVSKKKKRYQANGFDLDLSYILPNLIAMGFPAERFERVFRNNIEDVVKFMEAKHKDHYFIYNLCSERSYDHSKFHNRVAVFPIDDHNPPPFELIKQFCQDVNRWLKLDSRNVAAIHCKAGKGRTGVMVCAYIIHTNKEMDADSALNLYAEKRTHNRRGVTIPSQRRYVHYYERLVKSGNEYKKTPLYLRCIRMDPMPLSLKTNLAPSIVIWEGKQIVFKGCLQWRRWQDSGIYGEFHSPPRLNGDIKVEVYNGKVDFSANHNKVKGDRLFTFWFNTFFVKLESSTVTYTSIPSIQTPLATNKTKTLNISKPVPIPLSTDPSNTLGTPSTNNGKVPGKFKVTSSPPSPSSSRSRSRSTTNFFVMMLNNLENSTPRDENKSSSASSHINCGTICISPSSNLTSNYNCVTIPKVNGIAFNSISDQSSSPQATKGKPSIYNSSSSFNSSSIDPRKNSLSGSNTSEISQEDFTLNLKREDLDKLSKSLNPDFQIMLQFNENLEPKQRAHLESNNLSANSLAIRRKSFHTLDRGRYEPSKNEFLLVNPETLNGPNLHRSFIADTDLVVTDGDTGESDDD
ncbi:phosphatidylinositol 3,4,5-trisphosphate 3-phosphatase and dual-specificity protein phosphatase PTEN [Tetranychus urticae]|uniref:Phosphatidylinositol 3,4,5-trisphosphate 3-phosphatase and dual-specificity protein phosphatase PTEN n=1 Tax=Tetranychus urticae TaxID=32264 RepID=T1K2J2_TETUR|nr:phosphatidylinositol 3,4,5-trisphosphate 3-phosphatase and dual-specificity protein phosphatase PTEN [Tetranychus urticae]